MTDLSHTPGGPMTHAAFMGWESGDEFRYELIDGVPRLRFRPVRGMAAPSDAHCALANNLGVALATRLRAAGLPCCVEQGSAVRIPTSGADRTRFPDVTVRCGGEPVVLVEIRSPSNTDVEIRARLKDFRRVSSVREVIVVDQDQMATDLYRRVGDLWAYESVDGPDSVLPVASLGFEIPLDDLYLDVRPPEAV